MLYYYSNSDASDSSAIAVEESDWWLSGGISAANVVWAFDAANAANEAASYTDLSGNGNNATEDVATTWTTGLGWSSFGQISAPNGGIDATDPRTIIVHATPNSAWGQYLFGLGTTTTGQAFRVRGDSGDVRFEIEGSGYTSSLATTSTAYVIAARLNSGGTTLADVDLFLNGTKESCVGANSISTANNNIYIGSRGDSTLRFLGTIHQISAYNAALTDQQIIDVGASMAAL